MKKRKRSDGQKNGAEEKETGLGHPVDGREKKQLPDRFIIRSS